VSREFAYTFGALDGISVEGSVVSADGWVVGLEENVDDIVLEYDGQPIPTKKIGFEEASADVQHAYPGLRYTDRCRFRLQGKLPETPIKTNEGKLVAVIPLVERQRGIPLERIVPIRLTVPHHEQSLMVGLGDFVETSFSMLALLRLVGGLHRNARILEPGCGLGRIAFAIAHYLDRNGCYYGFDVSRDAIRVAQSIFPEESNMSFQHADLYNKMYNEGGAVRVKDFSFPFDDGYFDTVILTSVFTHMLPIDVRHFLMEISRVLVAGGICFCTFFAFDELAKDNLSTGKATLNIVHPFADGCFVLNRSVPENAVAYDMQTLQAMIAESGLHIEKVYWGQWSGHNTFLTYQDVFLLRKL
jgi:SAM-dependent methyltransferase